MSMLTAKQEAFCIEYVMNGGDGTRAYYKAYGASKAHAERVLQYPQVKERIKELRERIYAELDIKPEDVNRKLWEIANTDKAYHKDKVMALTQLSKNLGMEENTVTVNTPDVGNISIKIGKVETDD